MAGHSRSKNGVASLAYVPAIHVFLDCAAAKTWMPAFAGMTESYPPTPGLLAMPLSATRLSFLTCAVFWPRR
jgi:hypothetical protein